MHATQALCRGAAHCAAASAPGAPGATMHARRTELVRRGTLVHDAAQDGAFNALEDLRARVALSMPGAGAAGASEPRAPPATSWTCAAANWISAIAAARKNQISCGGGGGFGGNMASIKSNLYLYGGPGCGKTKVMDIFFDLLLQQPQPQPPPAAAMRVHFDEFMTRIHNDHHELMGVAGGTRNVFVEMARRLTLKYRVICLDEFQVTHVTDAMVLRRLLNVLLPSPKLSLVFTSNRAPDELYIGGLQRDSFLPCISEIKAYSHLVHVAGKQDYRRCASDSGSDSDNVLFVNDETKFRLLMARYAAAHGGRAEWEPVVSTTIGDNAAATATATASRASRLLAGQMVSGGGHARRAAHAEFDTLCRGSETLAVGGREYRVLLGRYDVLFISGVPQLKVTGDDRSSARRFVTLLDAAYECRTQIVVGAHAGVADIDGLFNTGGGGGGTGRVVGDEEEFAVGRARSRLHEMTRRAWIRDKALRRAADGHVVDA